MLEVLVKEGLADEARAKGQYLKDAYIRMSEDHPIIGDVRGRGMLLGMELVKDPETKEPAGEETRRLTRKCMENGLILQQASYASNANVWRIGASNDSNLRGAGPRCGHTGQVHDGARPIAFSTVSNILRLTPVRPTAIIPRLHFRRSEGLPESADVVVIGAGVVGCSVAYYLAREGVNVTILERESIGSGASAHATGSLSLLGAEFSPGASFELARASDFEFQQIVPELESATDIDLLYQRRPSLRLALDADEADLIKSLMVWQQPHVKMHWIDAQGVQSIEPRLSPSIIGAVYEDESAQLDSYRLNLALCQGAELLGAKILYREVTGLVTNGTAISGVRTASEDISCSTVVVAAGTWSRAFTPSLGFPIPVRPSER